MVYLLAQNNKSVLVRYTVLSLYTAHPLGHAHTPLSSLSLVQSEKCRVLLKGFF